MKFQMPTLEKTFTHLVTLTSSQRSQYLRHRTLTVEGGITVRTAGFQFNQIQLTKEEISSLTILF